MKSFRFYLCLTVVTIVYSGCCSHYNYPEVYCPEPLPPRVHIESPIRVALVLGGGGARGMAHVGVLKELEDAQIPIDLIVGCSAGGMIGALYSHTPDADHLKNLLAPMKKCDFVDFSIWRARYGLAQGIPLRNFLHRNIGDAHFCDLHIPLLVIATDLCSGELVCIGGGPIIPAVRASCALPFYLSPIHLYGRMLVDGGVVDLVPVDTALEHNPLIIVAVDLSESLPKTRPSNLFAVAKRSAEIKFLKHTEACLRGADIIVKPDVGNFDCFEDKCTMEIYEAGREATRAIIPLLKAKLEEFGYGEI